MKKYNNTIKAYRDSKFGRMVVRLFGEDSGQAMMEYVIIAVVIAAACALVMAIWGKSIFGEAEVASNAVTGEHNRARTAQEQVRTDKDQGIAEAVVHQNTFSDNDGQSATQH